MRYYQINVDNSNQLNQQLYRNLAPCLECGFNSVYDIDLHNQLYWQLERTLFWILGRGIMHKIRNLD